MSQQFLYVQFKVTPKGTLTRATGSETVAIELPAKHVADWKLERPDRYLNDEEIAIELTQGAAIAAADRFVVLTGDPPKGAGNPCGQVLTRASSHYERARL